MRCHRAVRTHKWNCVVINFGPILIPALCQISAPPDQVGEVTSIERVCEKRTSKSNQDDDGARLLSCLKKMDDISVDDLHKPAHVPEAGGCESKRTADIVRLNAMTSKQWQEVFNELPSRVRLHLVNNDLDFDCWDDVKTLLQCDEKTLSTIQKIVQVTPAEGGNSHSRTPTPTTNCTHTSTHPCQDHLSVVVLC